MLLHVQGQTFTSSLRPFQYLTRPMPSLVTSQFSLCVYRMQVIAVSWAC